MDGTKMNTRSPRPIALWLAIVALTLVVVPAAQADKKKKKKEAEPAPAKIEKIDHSQIDTSKLVWPLPPDVPRIKFVQELYGEERPIATEGQQSKKRQSWMDRVAGLPTTDSGAFKKDVRHLFAKPC